MRHVLTETWRCEERLYTLHMVNAHPSFPNLSCFQTLSDTCITLQQLFCIETAHKVHVARVAFLDMLARVEASCLSALHQQLKNEDPPPQ